MRNQTRWPTLRADDNFGYGLYFCAVEAETYDPEDIDYINVARAILLVDCGYKNPELVKALDNLEAILSDDDLECLTDQYLHAESSVIEAYLKINGSASAN
jgi:hypothetical protein